VHAAPATPLITQVGNVLTSSPAFAYQWQFNNVDIPGATNQSYTATQSGVYQVVVSNENGCTAFASVDVLVSGLEDYSSDDNISIFPNPSDGNFTISFSSDLFSEAEISVTNAIGLKILSSKEKTRPGNFSTSIHLKTFPQGLYYLEIQTGVKFIRTTIMISK